MSWKSVALGDVCDITGGGTPSKSNLNFYIGHIPWATVRDMNRDYLEETDFKISQEAVNESSTNIIPKNNVVIATRVGLGKVCILNQDTAINQDLRGVVPKNPKELDVKYLFFWFKSISKVIVDAGRGATVHGVTLPFIKSLQLPLPPLATQKKIVAKLDAIFAEIDKATAAAEANAKNAEALFQSYLRQAFEKEGNDWAIKYIGEISENLDSKRVPITKGVRQEGSIPYYGASGIVDYVKDFIFDGDILLISEDGANLLARTYPIAFSVSGRCWVNNHAHVVRFQNIISQKFVEFYLNSISLKPYVSGMAQPKLNQAMLNKIPIPFPALGVQEKFLRMFESIKESTSIAMKSHHRKIVELSSLKQGILRNAFAGELVKE